MSEYQEEIVVRFEPEALRSAAYDGERQVGECLLRSSEGVWTVIHTEVDPDYGGRSIAKRLVLAVAEAARAEGRKLKPLCSYAARVLSKPEFADLL